MNERIGYTARVLVVVVIVGQALLFSFGLACAENTGEKFVPSLLPAQEDQLLLNRRLQIAKRDIESFQIFAENFRNNGETKTLVQLQNPVDDFLKKHVDNLLAQSTENSPLETTKLSAEIMFVKARLFMSLNRADTARNTIAEMKKRFSSCQKISVELPGKTTTLDEGIRLLDEELAKTATTEKK